MVPRRAERKVLTCLRRDRSANKSDLRHRILVQTTSSKALMRFGWTGINITLCALLWSNWLNCPSVELEAHDNGEALCKDCSRTLVASPSVLVRTASGV